MKRKFRTPCIDCGAPGWTSRCPAHTKLKQAIRDAERGSPAERGYNAEYRANRQKVLAASLMCYWCGAVATTADHVVALANGGSNDLHNLVSSCAPCNSSRGGRTRRPGGEPRS